MSPMHRSISAMFCWVVVVLVLPVLGSSCFHHERMSLLQFKASVNDPSGRLHSWSAFNCCEWSGVQCHRDTGHVIALDLSNPGPLRDFTGRRIYGTALVKTSGDVITPLCNLLHLERLDLSSNQFDGVVISSGLGKLKRLLHLDLSWAGFTGVVPNELGNMSSLQYLDLSGYSDLHGRVLWIVNMRMWTDNMRHLRELVLDYVNMSKVASEEWGAALSSMPNLTRISMFSCELSGAIPSSLGNLSHLTHLNLGYNSFVSLPASLLNLSNLVSLSLPDIGLNTSSSIPSALLRLPRLQEVDLSSNHYLRGDLSSILPHHSTSLKSVRLSYTSIGGVIPDSFGNMSSLTVFALSGCDIRGTIPSTIANLSRLERLDLSRNKLEGSVLSLLVELRELQHVHLHDNKFQGNIPHTISKLSKLTHLSVRSNRLNGSFSESHLLNLSKLKYLDISDNLLMVKFSSTWIPRFSLNRLRLKSCNLKGELPQFLVTQYDMQLLDLSNNSLSGSIPLWIWDSLPLICLNLSLNHFDGPLPTNLAGSTNLWILDLHNNNLQGSIPFPPPSINRLDLSKNHFNSSIPIQIGKCLSDCSYLSFSQNDLSGSIPHSMCGSMCRQSDGDCLLDLSHNKLTGIIPSSCGNSNLVLLNLERNYLEGELSLEYMSPLQVLKLNGNRLNGSIPSSLATCKKLKILELGENNITGQLPNWIEKLCDLRVLNLKSNKLEGKIPSQVTKLSFLQVLNLSNNSFSGNIPNSISNFSAMMNESANPEWNTFNSYSVVSSDYMYPFIYSDSLVTNKGQEMEYAGILGLMKSIDLSNNNLTGTIPPEMGLLKGLIILNISRNHISGEIPGSLGNMTMLESLDLSQNHLSRMIPSELQYLTSLSYLNVSYNNLSGIIPQGNQLATFDSSAFSNNPGLCGFQIKKPCTPGIHSRPEDVEEKDKDEEEEEVWWAVAVGMSYAVTFGVVFAVMCLKKRCVQWMDHIILRLF